MQEHVEGIKQRRCDGIFFVQQASRPCQHSLPPIETFPREGNLRLNLKLQQLDADKDERESGEITRFC